MQLTDSYQILQPRQLLKATLALSSLLLLSNCVAFQKPEEKVVVQTEYIERQIMLQQPPKPVTMPNVQWYVVSEKNLAEFLERIKADNGSVAFMAITPSGYENLSIGVADLRRYILQQKEIIVYYEQAVQAPPMPNATEAPAE
jgi:hypothetical protein